MNIAHVIFRADRTRGGAERYCFDLAQTLVARGHRVSILASTHGDVGAASAVPIFARGLTRASRYQRFIDNVDLHLDGQRYDVVHAHLPIRRCDVYQAHSGLEYFAIRNGHHVKPTAVRRQLASLGARLSVKRARVAAVEASLLHGPRPPITLLLSDRERRDAAIVFPGAATRMGTLYSLPDDSRFDPAGLPSRRAKMRRILTVGDDQPLFVFAGQDFARKGLATAIAALGRTRKPSAVLYVLGDGDVSEYSRLALRAGVVGRVLFSGRVENVADYLAAADGLVMPTRYEPFGMVVVEAMLMGCPPIVSSVAGASEVVEDATTGFVIDGVDDPQPYADAMNALCDPVIRDRLRGACLAERSRFSYAAQVDTLEAIYRRAAGVAH